MAKIKIDEDTYNIVRREFLQRVHDDIVAGSSKGKKIKIVTTTLSSIPDPGSKYQNETLDQNDTKSESLRAKYKRLRAELKQREVDDGKKESSKKE